MKKSLILRGWDDNSGDVVESTYEKSFPEKARDKRSLGEPSELERQVKKSGHDSLNQE